MGRKVRIATVIVAVVLVFPACNRGDAEETTTTTASTNSSVTVDPAGSQSGTVTSTTEAVASVTEAPEPPPELGLPDYQIISREPGEGGDTVVVLLDPESYQELTDLDIQNVIGDVVEKFPPVLEAYIVDSPEVVNAVLASEPTPEEVELLNQHYFARLEEGFRMVFVGQFEAAGDAILGS